MFSTLFPCIPMKCLTSAKASAPGLNLLDPAPSSPTDGEAIELSSVINGHLKAILAMGVLFQASLSQQFGESFLCLLCTLDFQRSVCTAMDLPMTLFLPSWYPLVTSKVFEGFCLMPLLVNTKGFQILAMTTVSPTGLFLYLGGWHLWIF